MPTTSVLREEVVATRPVLSGMSERMVVLESRYEDAENELRRSNFIFYGFRDSENETGVGAKKLVLDWCSEHLGVNVDANAVQCTQTGSLQQ